MANFMRVVLALSPSAILAVRHVEMNSLASLAAVNSTADFPNVCCMHESGSFEIYDPYTSQAQSLLAKCRLVSFIEKNCGTFEVCHKTCEANIKADSRYYGLKAKDAEEERDKAAKEIVKTNKQAEQERDTLKSKADAQHQKTNEKAESDLARVQQEHDARSKVLQKAKEAYEKAKAAMEKAEKEFNEQTTLLEKEKAARQSAAAEAKAAKEKSEKEATAAFDKVKEEGAQLLKKKQEAIDAQVAEKESHTSQAPPSECKDSETCCCSVIHVPVRVDTRTFLDWDKCKGPKSYAKTSMFQLFNCNFMSECSSCRELICDQKGVGMCP